MAERVTRDAPGRASTRSSGRSSGRSRAEEDAAETLNILHPERGVLIADRAVEVREYGYIEGLKLQAACKAFLDDLFIAFSRAEAPPTAEGIAEVMAEHILTVQWMIAQAITPLSDDDPQAFVRDVTANAQWIGALAEEPGDLLTAAWWEVNKRFFTRRLQRRALAANAAARPASLSASNVSTTP